MDTFQTINLHATIEETGGRYHDNLMVFCDPTHWLSLDHHNEISFSGYKFQTIRHLILHFKALAFDAVAAKTIAEVPAHQASLVQIKKFDVNTWKRIEVRAVRTAVVIALKQSQQLRAALKATGMKRIVYASFKDSFLGCGLSITDENVVYPQFWRGANVYGKMLETLRKTV